MSNTTLELEWKRITDEYIQKYSQFQAGESVFLRKREYLVDKVEIDNKGHFNYLLISPRSHERLPLKYTVSQLEKISSAENV